MSAPHGKHDMESSISVYIGLNYLSAWAFWQNAMHYLNEPQNAAIHASH